MPITSDSNPSARRRPTALFGWLVVPPLLLVGLFAWSCARPVEVPLGNGGFGFGRYFGVEPDSGLFTNSDGGVFLKPIPPGFGGGSYVILWGSALTDPTRSAPTPPPAPPISASTNTGTSPSKLGPTIQITPMAKGTRVRVGEPVLVEFRLPSGWVVSKGKSQRSADMGTDDFQFHAKYPKTAILLSLFGVVLDKNSTAGELLELTPSERKAVKSCGQTENGIRYFRIERGVRSVGKSDQTKPVRYHGLKLRKGRIVLEASVLLPVSTPEKTLTTVDRALKELQRTARISSRQTPPGSQ